MSFCLKCVNFGLSVNQYKDWSSSNQSHIAAMSQFQENGYSVIVEIFSLIQRILSPTAQKEGPVIIFKQPEELKATVDLALHDDDAKSKRLVELCEQIVKYSVKSGHPFFLNQLYGGTDCYGLAAAVLISALNTNVYTFDVAPVLSLIEQEVLTKIASLLGFHSYEGSFCPGGSIANMFGLSLARFIHDKTFKQRGLYNSKRLLIFTSAQSHYSVLKGAAFMGFGTDSVITVRCLRNGAMDPRDLQSKIEQALADPDGVPLLVWATSGTTVLNAFDPLVEIADLCAQYKLWLHVDACLGGAVLLSKKHRNLLDGIERADSVVWNWHKILGAPIQTSIFMTSHKGLLKECHSSSANYLFQASKHYDTAFDSGDASIMCGRRPDALKVWLMWKARGAAGLEQVVDVAYDNAQYLYTKLACTDGFKLVLDKAQGSTVCFWVIPPRLRGKPETDEFWAEVAQIAPAMKLAMVQRGSMMINYQELTDQGLKNFFRITITCHPQLVKTDVDQLVAELLLLAELV